MTSYTAAMPVGYETARYPNLARVLAPEFASLSSAEIRALMEYRYGPGAAEHYEEYFEGIFDDVGRAFSSAAKDVGRFAAKAAPVVAHVGGGALQGALAGAALGPVGIIGGAALGGAGAGLSRYGKGTARDVGGVLSGVTGIAGQFTPLGRIGTAAGPVISGLAGGGGLRNAAGAALGAVGGALGGGAGSQALGALGGLIGGGKGGGAGLAALSSLAGGAGGGQVLGALGGLLGGDKGGAGLGALTSLFGGGNATTQLLSLLRRPETMQALAALSLGPAGRRSIPVGSAQTPVPVGAVTNLIGQLANQAAAEAAALGDGAEASLQYMTDESGEFVGDPALDRDRAARLWDLLNVAQAERLSEAVAFQQSTDEAAYDERAAEAYDAAEIAYYDAMDQAEAESLMFMPVEDYSEDYGEDLTEGFGEWNESESYGYA
jgi:hypothetical protein